MGKKFAEYSKLDLSEVNGKVLKKWDENQVFVKSMTEREIGRASCRERVCLYV